MPDPRLLKPGNVHVSIQIPKSLRKQVHSLAVDEDRTKNDMFEELLRRGLKNGKEEER